MKVIAFIFKGFGKIFAMGGLLALVGLTLIFYAIHFFIDLIASLIDAIFLSKKECYIRSSDRTTGRLHDFLDSILGLMSNVIKA